MVAPRGLLLHLHVTTCWTTVEHRLQKGQVARLHGQAQLEDVPVHIFGSL